MISLTCPVCGGKLNIKIGAEIAVCESCGNVTELNPGDVAKYRAMYNIAESTMRKNTADGYRDAIRKLETIEFINEAKELSDECRRRLSVLQADQARRQEFEKTNEKKSTFLGVLLVVLILLFCIGAIVGAVYLVIGLVKGTLSPALTAIIIGVAVLAVIFIFKTRSK